MNDYHHGNLRETLLTEGLTLLNEEGYGNFSLRKLARRCGVSHNSPYRHFKDKEELILAISHRGYQAFAVALEESIQGEFLSPQETLNSLGRGYVRFFLDNPDYLDLIFLSPQVHELTGQSKGSEKRDASLQIYLKTMVPLMSKEEQKQFENKTFDINQISGKTLQPWCLIHGLTVLLVKKALPMPTPQELDRLIEQVLSS